MSEPNNQIRFIIFGSEVKLSRRDLIGLAMVCGVIFIFANLALCYLGRGVSLCGCCDCATRDVVIGAPHAPVDRAPDTRTTLSRLEAADPRLNLLPSSVLEKRVWKGLSYAITIVLKS
ncbi:hypothetical protein BDZ89DRAFT_1044177 [Hymenopellis radicata]|nr:hypothetical protein BDZ89DRAFT_1044177 [Hymenopellis radicata]